jgi:hypothetical protein
MSDWQITAPLGTPNKGPNRFDIMASGVRGKPRNRGDLPGEPIYVRNGAQRVESGFYRTEEDGRIQYVDQEGRPVDERRLEAARAFDLAQREGKIFDLESQQAVDIGGGEQQERTPRAEGPTGMSDEQVATRQAGIRESAAQARMNAGPVEGVEFDSWSAARITDPEILRQVGVEGAITETIARNRLTQDQARAAFEATFSRPVPSNMSPKEALAEELRNMRRQ